MSDKLKELPEGWCYAFLSELGNLSRGKSKHRPRNDPKLYGEFVPFIQTGEVARSKGRISSFSKMYSEFGVQQSRIFPKGTVCITIAANIADTGILGFDACFPDSVVGLVTDDNLTDPYFVEYFLRTIREDLAQFAPATAQANINLEILNKVSVPIPPLNEQKRIVDKIEELRDRHQRAKQALESIPELCDRFRQSVLAAAFRGELTADWREENPDVEPASHLLKRIKERRLTTAKTDRQKESMEEIYTYEEEYGSELLPESWQHFSLEKLCSFQYGTSSKSLPEGKVPVLRMGNLQNGEIDWSDLVYTSDEDEITKYLLQPGDVLFNRTNSPDLVGKTSIYRGERSAIFAGYLIKIGNYAELNSEYLNYCLNTNYARDYCWRVKTDGVSQSNINAQKLAKFEIPFCSLQEQQEIVRRIHSLFQAISQVKQQHLDSKNLLDRLNQSVLAKAFRGELVEQDPNDEPAAVLLERIRAEREKADNGKKTKGKRAKQLKLEV